MLKSSKYIKANFYSHVLVQKHERKCCSSRSFGGYSLLLLLPLYQSCPGSAPSDVCSQKSAVKRLWWVRREEEERGAGVFERKGRARKGPEENPSFSRLELNLTNLAQLPLMLQSPVLISFSFLSLYLLPLIFSLSAHFSMPLAHIWAASHTLRLQLGKIQRLLLFPESFQFGTEPLGHCGTAQCLHTPPY